MSLNEKKFFENGVRFSRHADVDEYMSAQLGEEYAAYRRRWNSTMSADTLPAIPFRAPLYLALSLIDDCNLRCLSCFRHTILKKATRTMLSIETVKALTDEARELGIESINIGNGFCEPLLYPEVNEALELCSKAGFKDVILPTNGLLMTREKLDVILDTVTRVQLSIDAATEGTYKVVRGGDWNVLMRNIDAFLDARAKRGRRLPLFRVSFIVRDETREEIQAFHDKWIDIADVVDFQNLLKVPENDTLRQDLPPEIPFCSDPFRMLLVESNGDILPCCSAYARYLRPLGKYPDMSLKEAWSSGILSAFRKTLSSKETLCACRNCWDRTWQ